MNKNRMSFILNTLKKISIFFVSLIIITSCSVDPEIKPIIQVDDIAEIIPDGWPTPFYNYSNNPLTLDGFILGKELFYDPILSSDNTISCASCHQQFAAFAHSGHNMSHGINGLLGTRNAPALQNLNWNPNFMHDGGVNNLEVFPPAPITNTVEMNETLPNVVLKVSGSGKYKQLFLNAFGNDDITTQRLFKAIAQFMGTMYSYNSKYDMVKHGKASFSNSEQNGYNLFVQKCATCHKEPLFSDYAFRNNGLSVNSLVNDIGRAHITQSPSDNYKFKTPSLRNIEKSSPYMHDGRFNTLDECLNHYISGIVNSPTLASELQSGNIPLSVQEKMDIISFLKTLTDPKFLTDQRFTNPN